MKKFITKVSMVAAFAAVAGYGVYASQEKEIALSDTVMANVEALATDENPMCPNGCLSDGDGCLCYIWYKDFREKVW